ncbi:unnamed protein product [Paramecium primaurelia]|uniref:Uncharacterized protein n=1 Tax=Paramecium primaurelia TaxID=5886 RepID=A0A8S1JMN3_PARPR|nr:unnamed protein product [Paramecium primaurelia]
MIPNNNTKQSFQDLTKKIILTTNILVNKIEIKAHEYQTFWELLNEGQDNASIYVLELLKIIDQTEYKRKKEPYSLESLLATLLTISMFKNVENVKKQRDYKEVKQNWDHHIVNAHKKQQLMNPYSISIVCNLHFIFESQQLEDNNFTGFLIGAIAFMPDLFKVAKPENIELMYDSLKQHYQLVEQYGKTVRIKNDSFYNLLLDERFDLQETGEFMFCYEYLIKQIRTKYKNSQSRVFYDSLLKYFKMIPFIAQDFPEQAEKSALSLLHMTKQLITFYGCEIVDLLKSLLNQIEIFRRWPFPVGVMANELVQILYQEQKSRGNAFRMKIREEIPQIDFFDDDQSQDIQFQSVQEQQIPISGLAQQKQESQILSVYVFYENRQNNANNVLQYAQFVLRNKNQNYAQLYTPNSLRCYICAQILQLQQKKNQGKSPQLSAFKEVDIFNLYCKLLTIVEKCDNLDSIADIELIYENAFDEITKELMKHTQEPNNVQKEVQAVMSNQLSIPDFPLFYFHNVIQKSFTFTAPKQSFLKFEQGQFMIPNQLIKDFVQRAYDNYMPLHTEPLRLLVVGSDAEIFEVCMLLGEIYQKNPLLLRTLDIRVFIVPTKDCALAQFLAVKDPWYQRYLYLPFMEDILIPKLESIKEDNNKYVQEVNKVQGQLPLEQKAWCLNTYLREGNRAYNVRVYKLTIYQKKLSYGGIAMADQKSGLNPKSKSDEVLKSTLYFCSYVMFGAIAEFELQKERSKDEKLQKLSFYDFKEKNLCKFQYLNIQMITEQTDMLGNIINSPNKEEKVEKIQVQLHNCKINNVYTDFFEGNMPMPHTDWLELSYITYENSKLFDSGLRQKNIFKKHSQESIQNAFKSLFTNISITKINVEEQTKKPFSIIVDGNIYTDIVSFKICSTHMKRKKKNNQMQKKEGSKDEDDDLSKQKHLSSIIHLNLPVMSFLPFKV